MVAFIKPYISKPSVTSMARKFGNILVATSTSLGLHHTRDRHIAVAAQVLGGGGGNPFIRAPRPGQWNEGHMHLGGPSRGKGGHRGSRGRARYVSLYFSKPKTEASYSAKPTNKFGRYNHSTTPTNKCTNKINRKKRIFTYN